MAGPIAEVTPLIGRTLGHYRIVAKIGEGGMGEVYRARDEHLDCDVAIKVLAQGSLNDESARKRFHKEARALSRLNHPNIAIVHDFDTQQGVDYLVMEYISGTTLSDRLVRGKLPEKEVVALGMQLAEGLCAAHEHGVIHSDLKPGNLQLTEDGRLKILDFGLAKFRFRVTATARTETLSAQGTVAGTLPYMAPEQLLAGEIDARTDIHAAGCVLYEMATGRRPFSEVESPKLIGAVLNRVPLAPRAVNPAISEELERIIDKCLEKEPENRYQSARELAIDLRRLHAFSSSGPRATNVTHSRAVGAAGSLATSLSTGESSRRYPRRSAVSRAAFIVASALILIVAAALLLRSNVFGPPSLKIIATKQLTFHGQIFIAWGFPFFAEFMPSIQSDGRRIYYISLSDRRLYSMPVAGGEPTAISSVPPLKAFLLHISPDGGTLLAKEAIGPQGSTESALWLLATNSGFARQLGDVQAHDAAWFPDGRSIIFAAGNALYATDESGANVRKLFDIPGRAFWIRWAPDRKRFRFTLLDVTNQARSIWEATAAGRLHRFLPNWKEAGDVCCGEWTRDGRHFVFRNTRDNRTDYWRLDESAFSLRPASPVLLSTGGLEIAAVATSPTESKLFAVGVQLNRQMVKFDLVSRRSEKFLPNLNAARVVFSPDRQWMTIVQSHGTERVLWQARADGTEWRQLTVPPMVVLLASYSPDGKRIAFMGKAPNRPWKIYWVAADGGALHELRVPIENQGDPNWSLDSESIMFGQPPFYFGEPNIPRAIYIYNLGTHQISKLPRSEGWFSPRWSPDRSHVAAISIDARKLAVFDFVRQQWRELAHGSIDSPFWSPDGAWVYFNSPEDGLLRRVRVGGGPVQEILTFSDVAAAIGDCGADGFTPDSRLLIACGRTDANIYALQWSE